MGSTLPFRIGGLKYVEKVVFQVSAALFL